MAHSRAFQLSVQFVVFFTLRIEHECHYGSPALYRPGIRIPEWRIEYLWILDLDGRSKISPGDADFVWSFGDFAIGVVQVRVGFAVLCLDC
jgi:hypothetical protein